MATFQKMCLVGIPRTDSQRYLSWRDLSCVFCFSWYCARIVPLRVGFGRLISKAFNIVLVFFWLDQLLALQLTCVWLVVNTTDLKRALIFFGRLCSGVVQLAVLLARLVVWIVIISAFTRRIGSKQVTTRYRQMLWIILVVAEISRLWICIVVVVKKLLACD